MAAPRLTDSQKSELVARYRDGIASSVLAEAYGCSLNTVSRVVKAALDPADYAQLKQQRAKAVPRPGALGTDRVASDRAASDAVPLEAVVPAEGHLVEAGPGLDPNPDPLLDLSPEPDLGNDPDSDPDCPEEPASLITPVLAIDDADDFGEDPEADDPTDSLDGDGFDDDQFVAVPIALIDHSIEPAQCQPLAGAALPASVYMLVDKTVELQAKPLKEFPELGHLPLDEEERQALLVFANPRQAKRQCGRTQRVIKVPDTRIFERTASYLLAQGISRVVLEGSLYSLPGS